MAHAETATETAACGNRRASKRSERTGERGAEVHVHGAVRRGADGSEIPSERTASKAAAVCATNSYTAICSWTSRSSKTATRRTSEPPNAHRLHLEKEEAARQLRITGIPKCT